MSYSLVTNRVSGPQKGTKKGPNGNRCVSSPVAIGSCLHDQLHVQVRSLYFAKPMTSTMRVKIANYGSFSPNGNAAGLRICIRKHTKIRERDSRTQTPPATAAGSAGSRPAGRVTAGRRRRPWAGCRWVRPVRSARRGTAARRRALRRRRYREFPGDGSHRQGTFPQLMGLVVPLPDVFNPHRARWPRWHRQVFWAAWVRDLWLSALRNRSRWRVGC
jgi:hypothetical protein